MKLQKLSKPEVTLVATLRKEIAAGARLNAEDQQTLHHLTLREFSQTAAGRGLLLTVHGLKDPQIQLRKGPNGPTLGGDLSAMISWIAEWLNVGRRTARKYLNSACECIEFACDETSALRRVTFQDILDQAAELQQNVRDERRAPKHP